MDNQQFQPVQNQSIWTIILPTIIITALIVGGGVWYWQKSSFEKEKKELQQQIEELENQVSETSDKIYRNEKHGFEFKIESNWIIEEDQDILPVYKGILSIHKSDSPLNVYGGRSTLAIIRIVDNSENLSMEDFYDGQKNVNFFNDAQAGYSNVTIDGKPSIRFKDLLGMIPTDAVVIPLDGKFIEIDSAMSDISNDFTVFDQILSTFKFIN